MGYRNDLYDAGEWDLKSSSALTYDAEKVADFIEDLRYVNERYNDKLGMLGTEYDHYRDNQTFVGRAATASKYAIESTQKGYLHEGVYNIEKAIYDKYCDLDDMFKEMVDPSPKARIDTDVIENIKRDYTRQAETADIAGRVIEDSARWIEQEFGDLGQVTQVNYDGVRAIYDEFSGNGGFLDKCVKRMEDYENEALIAVNNSELDYQVSNLQSAITKASGGLGNMKMYNPSMPNNTISLVALGANAAVVSNVANTKKGAQISQEVKMLMDVYGFTKEEAELLNKAIVALDNASLNVTKDPYKRIEHIYGTLSALCHNYNGKRWRLASGYKTMKGAKLDLQFAGLTDQEILDLQVLINLQHGDFSDETLAEDGIDISRSSFSKETHAAMVKRMNGNINDFAHSTVQLAAFAHGDDMYKNLSVDPKRWGVDLFNSPNNSKFGATMTRYEISFKGDMDSGRYSEEDYKSDIDANNIYDRMLESGDVKLGTWKTYYDDLDKDSKLRATEFFENMGDGDVGIGILNTKKVIEEKTYGSTYIIESNGTDIKTARSVFMQWIMSVYQGVEYDFPKSD